MRKFCDNCQEDVDRRGFCRRCREPICHNGYDWIHDLTGNYLGYRDKEPEGHVAIPGGRRPRKNVKNSSQAGESKDSLAPKRKVKA